MSNNLCSYLRWCSLCQNGYTSNQEWLAHLPLKSHQDSTTENSWESKEKLECCVVVFTRPGNGQCLPHDLVLKYFSDLQGLRGGLVTDFVWSAERKNILVLQFESRLKVEGIFAALGASHGQIEGQSFVVRRLSEYMGIERQCILPWIFRPSVEDIKIHQTPNSNPDPPVQPTPIQVPLSLPVSQNNHELRRTSRPLSLEAKLIQDFKDIMKSVEIPKEQYLQVLNLMERVQKSLEQKLTGCKLFLFRHWYLRLRSLGTNELLIFVRHDKQLQLTTSADFYSKLFESSGAKFIKLKKDQDFDENSREPHGFRYLDGQTGLQFSLVDSGFIYTEAQACQLMNQLVSLDPRVKGLMTLVLYWAKVNGVPLQKEMVTTTGTFMAPVPAVLEWLVIFYVVKNNVIPSAKKVMKKPFDRNLSDRLLDPGFPMTSDWIQSCHLTKEAVKAKFVKNVIRLTCGFFRFFSIYLQNCKNYACILNPRDGQVITVKKDDSQHQLTFKRMGSPLGDHEKKLFQDESFQKALQEQVKEQKSYGVKTPVYLLHPIHFKNGFKLDNEKLAEAWSKMRNTAERLEMYLETWSVQNCEEKMKGFKCILDLVVEDNEFERRGAKRKRNTSE